MKLNSRCFRIMLARVTVLTENCCRKREISRSDGDLNAKFRLEKGKVFLNFIEDSLIIVGSYFFRFTFLR